MNIESVGYKLNSNLGEDYLEVSLRIRTNFDKEDLPYMKLFIHEALESTKAYCNSERAHSVLKVHNYIRNAYAFFMPAFIYAGCRFYKRMTKGRIQMAQGFKQKTKIRSAGLLKTSCVFIPVLFVFSAFFEYSNRLPLLFLKESMIKASDKQMTFEDYLHFKKKLNQMTNEPLNTLNNSNKLKH